MIPPAVIILACLDLPLVAEMKTDKRERGREAGVEARAVGKDGGQMEPFVPSLFPGHSMFQRVLASPIEAPLPSASLS